MGRGDRRTASANAEPDDLGTAKTRDGYDAVAAEYATHIADELAAKPLDRALLDAFAEQVRGRGTVADLGCGPGQVARYLHDRGLPAIGINLSPEMVAVAERLHPCLTFRVGSIVALDVGDGAWGGIVAFYSIIHLPPGAVPRAFAEFSRALRPGGYRLLAYHVGAEVRHLAEWWGRSVDLDFHFFSTDDVAGWLTTAGFAVEARLEREPYPAVEVATRRGYLLARKPSP